MRKKTEENLKPQVSKTHKNNFLHLQTLYSVYFRPKVRRKGWYLIGKVDDNEGCVGHARFLEVLAVGVSFIELLGPVLIRSFGDLKKHKTG